MDYSDQISEEINAVNLENDPGTQELINVQEEEQVEEESNQRAKFETGFSGSDLSATGPNTDDYDYETEYKESGSFAPDEEGGINLSNKNMKPDVHEIAGYDSVTGKQYTNEFDDYSGMIKEGIADLQTSSVNTKTGAPPRDMLALSKVANGMEGEGADYDSFVKKTPGNWSDSQRAIAWDGMKHAKQTSNDVQTYGKRHFDNAESLEYKRMEGVEQDVDEDTLVTSANWIQNGRNVIEYFNPNGSEQMDEQEVHDFNLNLMSTMNYNLPMMMFYANEVEKSEDPELAKSFLYLMDQNQATNVSYASAERAVSGIAGDISTYMTLGGSVLVSRLTAAGMKAGIRQTLSKLGAVTAVDSAAGGAMGASQEKGTQDVEIVAGERDKLDKGAIATAGAVGAAATTVLGVGAATVADPVLRKFATGTVKNAINKISPMPKAPNIQPIKGPPKPFAPVRFKSRLDTKISEVFASSKKSKVSVANLQSQAKKWVKDGTVRKEEVDWAGLNMLDPKEKLDVGEIKAFVGHNRPVPTLQKTVENSFENMSFKGGNYREHIITIDKVGDYGGPESHFGNKSIGSGARVGNDNANVGHLRMEDTTHSGETGTMFLEGQADIVKTKNNRLEARSPVAKKLKKDKDEVVLTKAEDKMTKHKAIVDDFELKMSKKYGIVLEGNDRRPLYNAMSDSEIIERNMLMVKENDAYEELMDATDTFENSRKITPFTPFRKRNTSGPLLFRSAFMEAMNSDSKFLAWPKTHEQVAEVEGWANRGIKDITVQRFKDASRFMTTDMKKIAESHGLKVEEFIPDNMKNRTKTEIVIDAPDASTGEMSFGSMDEAEAYSMDAYSISLDEAFSEGVLELVSDKVIKLPDETFYRIKITPELREKWGKEGAAMYSFGAGVVGTGAAIKSNNKQKRNKNGKFM